VIELFVAAALSVQNTDAPPGDCHATVDRIEVRHAVRAGQAENIIEAADLVEDCAGREELLVLATQAAWEEQDLEAVSLLGSSALRLVGDRGCAWSPLAARLAFATGFSRLVTDEQGASFYFYAAQAIHDRSGGLNNSWRFVAEEFDDGFGTYPPDDIFAFGSPYIETPYRTDDDLCGDLPDLFIRFDGQVEGVAYSIFDLETDRDGDIRRVRHILSYPGSIPDGVERALRGRRSHDAYHDGYHMIPFRPCAPDWFIFDGGDPVCIIDVPEGEPTFSLEPKN
jgi:hypothetical protein